MRDRLARAGMAASVAAAFGASICCIGPIVAATFGLTSLAALVRYESLRPTFTAVTLSLLGAAFFLSYRKGPAEGCQPGSVCETHGSDRMRRINRVILWITTGIVIVIWTFPAWSSWILG